MPCSNACPSCDCSTKSLVVIKNDEHVGDLSPAQTATLDELVAFFGTPAKVVLDETVHGHIVSLVMDVPAHLQGRIMRLNQTQLSFLVKAITEEKIRWVEAQYDLIRVALCR